ncbi:MAG: hypothetical protein V1894_00540 [Chloroflexota bacterium]
MGNRDIRQREAKKPKKDARKVTSSVVIPAPVPEVQVIKTKGKKPQEEEEEE